MSEVMSTAAPLSSSLEVSPLKVVVIVTHANLVWCSNKENHNTKTKVAGGDRERRKEKKKLLLCNAAMGEKSDHNSITL